MVTNRFLSRLIPTDQAQEQLRLLPGLKLLADPGIEHLL